MRRTGGLEILWRGGILAAGLALLGTLAGCVAVGYSSRGGVFFWPRELAVVVVIVLAVLLLRRRR